uniref:Uncharacterized protein n=1 Tax=Anguilla anguilla TaxID=7936 RepID=A0A0E9X572_ANGAN
MNTAVNIRHGKWKPSSCNYSICNTSAADCDYEDDSNKVYLNATAKPMHSERLQKGFRHLFRCSFQVFYSPVKNKEYSTKMPNRRHLPTETQ